MIPAMAIVWRPRTMRAAQAARGAPGFRRHSAQAPMTQAMPVRGTKFSFDIEARARLMQATHHGQVAVPRQARSSAQAPITRKGRA